MRDNFHAVLHNYSRPTLKQFLQNQSTPCREVQCISSQVRANQPINYAFEAIKIGYTQFKYDVECPPEPFIHF